MERTQIGQAGTVRRWTPTWPSRKATYFDFSPWGGGYLRLTGAPGAVVLAPGVLADIRTGQVYRDARFNPIP